MVISTHPCIPSGDPETPAPPGRYVVSPVISLIAARSSRRGRRGPSDVRGCHWDRHRSMAAAGLVLSHGPAGGVSPRESLRWLRRRAVRLGPEVERHWMELAGRWSLADGVGEMFVCQRAASAPPAQRGTNISRTPAAVGAAIATTLKEGSRTGCEGEERSSSESHVTSPFCDRRRRLVRARGSLEGPLERRCAPIYLTTKARRTCHWAWDVLGIRSLGLLSKIRVGRPNSQNG
jgi:hypothetical protein